MNPNHELINNFYKAFQNKDYRTMQNCYADNAVFSDNVFKNLNGKEVKAMWEMLIQRGKDLHVEFKNVKADDSTGSAEWIATYTFSKTKRKVVNSIKADFIFKNGKIVKHTDHFNFYAWSKQALGLTGWVLGWTKFLNAKVSKTAMQGLHKFMQKGK